MLKMSWLLILFLVFLNCKVVSADAVVSWGGGKLNITDSKGNEKSQQKFNLMQTQLLIDKELSSAILSKSSKEKVFKFDFKDGDLETLKVDIKKTILAGSPKDIIADTPKETTEVEESADYEIENHKSLIVVGKGETYLVDVDDVVTRLVVMGGTVKIAGEVTKLVLIKGEVEVLSTGKISEKVSELSGTINVDQGGFVTSDKTGMLDDLNLSNIVINQFTDFSGVGFKLGVSFLRFIQIIFLLWLAFKIIPYFNKNLVMRKYNWLQEGFVGLLHLCVFPFLVFFLSITFIGLGIVPLYIFLLYIMGLLGYGLICSIAGSRLVTQFSPGKEYSFFIYFLIGFVVFESFFLLPLMGGLIFFVLLILSIGLMTNVFLKYKKA